MVLNVVHHSSGDDAAVEGAHVHVRDAEAASKRDRRRAIHGPDSRLSQAATSSATKNLRTTRKKTCGSEIAPISESTT